MNLPDYFLADLPAEAELNPGLITEACQTLKRNQERYLQDRATDSIIAMLDGLGREWLSPHFPFRRRLIESGPNATGFSEQVLAAGLDHFFQQLTSENLESLLAQDTGHRRRLDNFFPGDHDRNRLAFAQGPRLVAHIAPGNIPNPVLSQMIFGLLTRSAQFVKCASGAALIPRLFAHSLYDADPKLGACLEIATWKGGAAPLEAALFAEADCVVATGDDGTLQHIHKRLPPSTRFIGYGTRVSFGFVTKEILSTHHPCEVVGRAAQDIVAWNQLGCLSPHVIYVEEGGTIPAEEFAHALAAELESLETTHPRGPLNDRDAAAIATRRGFYEVRAAHTLGTKMWASIHSTAWTVIFENDPLFQLSCLHRFVYVKAVSNLTQALQGVEMMRDKISTVGVAATATQMPDLAKTLARWGARRICPLGRMQQPPLGWRHDGRPALGELLTWIDWEK